MLKVKLAALVCALLIGGGVALVISGSRDHHPAPIRVTAVGSEHPTTAVDAAARSTPPAQTRTSRTVDHTSRHHHAGASDASPPQSLREHRSSGSKTTAATQPVTTSTTTPNTNVATEYTPNPRSSGMSISIPAIGVDAPIVTVGVAADHTIAVPPLDRPNETAWYDGSARPGQQGAAVIVGHIDTAATGPAVFYKLPDLRPGDRITIRARHRTRFVYRVDGLREYRKTSVPIARVFGPVSYPALRLISCTGAFDYATGHYLDNVVVYASIVS